MADRGLELMRKQMTWVEEQRADNVRAFKAMADRLLLLEGDQELIEDMYGGLGLAGQALEARVTALEAKQSEGR